MTDVISKPLTRFRADVARGIQEPNPVERDGGFSGHGLIRSVSVITRGEALGHGMWIDADFLSDVTSAINAASAGIKARFTHPGLSGDGLGKYLGRLQNARVMGDQVTADLHFGQSAHEAPDGDLAAYVMTLAEDDPEAFGVSIVFENDLAAMELHTLENTRNDRFVSPDEDNRHNYPHARLAQLRAGDVVDEPAANPAGLFHRGHEFAEEADQVLEYALGLSDEKPELSRLNVDAERLSAAVSRFLSRHDLHLTKGEDMADNPEVVEETTEETQPTRDEFAAEFSGRLAQYTEAFGAENAVAWLQEGVEFSDAQTRHIGVLEGRIEALQAKCGELQETLNSLDTGEGEPAEFNAGDAVESKKTLSGRIRIAGKAYDQN